LISTFGTALLAEHRYHTDQIRFLRAVQSVFLQKRHLEPADTSTVLSASLYDAPALVGFGQGAVERWFLQDEVQEVVEFVNRMAV
jgi:type I restriction enzyme R subunit